MTDVKKIIAILLALNFCQSALANDADTKKQFQILNRCFALVTGEALRFNSPYFEKLKHSKAQDICFDLVNSVHLNEKGVAVSDDPNNIYVKEILARFHLVHQSWFNTVKVSAQEDEFATSTVVDLQTGSNYLTYTMLNPKTKISEIFRINKNLVALRDHQEPLAWVYEFDPKELYLEKVNHREWSLALYDIPVPVTPSRTPSSAQAWKPELVQNGTLKGVTLSKIKNTVFPHDSYGGGILGTQAYLLTNITGVRNHPTDGALKMHRRWSENIFKDFFCRDLPVLSEMDIATHVNINSKINFQANPVCLKCHQTMDPLAAGIRNLAPVWSNESADIKKFIVRYLRKLATTEEAKLPLVSDSPRAEYAQSAPYGQLNYRDVDNNLKSFDFSNLNELGNYVANSKDLYYCYSKRYVKYFTGFDFSVVNSGDQSAARLEYNRISENFFKHQNQKMLVKDILESRLFTDGKQYE